MDTGPESLRRPLHALRLSNAPGIGLALLILCLSAGRAQSLNPSGRINVHDPVLIKAGGTYYLYHTGNRVAVKTSSDMKVWADAGSALPAVPSWHGATVPGNRAGDLWAPDISFRDGAYWLYYSVSSFGSNTSAIGLATRTSLSTGAWEDKGMVITSTTFPVNDNAIDPNIISDAQGKLWMSWGSFWNGLYMVQLDPGTGKPAAAAQAIHIAGRGGSGIEAPFIIHARGYYHLFVSWDRCCAGAASTYNMRYGRSANVTGPYLDKAGKPMTEGGGTLLPDGSGFPGGHNAVFEENGSYYLVYHVYTPGNTLQIRRLFFDGQGWPTLDASASSVILRAGNASSPGSSIPAFLYDPLGRSARESKGSGRGQGRGAILLPARGPH